MVAPAVNTNDSYKAEGKAPRFFLPYQKKGKQWGT